MSHTTDSLYARVLGDDFAKLHPILRRFHSLSQSHATGRLCVTRRGGWLGGLLATLLGLPPAGVVDVCLKVTPISGGERWTRSFASRPFVTDQFLHKGVLVERAGLGSFGLTVEVVEGGMALKTCRAWLAFVRLPLVLSPSVSATAVPTETGWQLVVSMKFPLLGEVVEYRGEMTPQWT